MTTLQDQIDAINELDAMPGLTLSQIAETIGLEYDPEEGVIVFDDTIYADDGNCEVAYPSHSRKEAAEDYVNDGDWGESQSTSWVCISTYKKGIGLDRLGFAEDHDYDYKGYKITIDPKEPDCLSGMEHDWRSPYSVVGGLKENPGVFGNGGGVISKECCAHCGKYKISDSWAEDPSDGQQGLDSVSYEDADDDSKAYVERRIIKNIEEKFDELDVIKSYTADDGKITAVIDAEADFDQVCSEIETQLDGDRLRFWADENERTLEITISV